jgi:phosphonopyruvate decarboxylase
MTRLEATRRVVSTLLDEAVVASLGHPAYDLFAAGDRDRNFYTWGSMGAASSIGLGLAMARPDLHVVVLDGDGSLLMNLGSLATIGTLQPPNLVLLVWDNGEYGTTGGQTTATAHGTDLMAVARGCGIARAITVDSLDAIEQTMGQTQREPGPWVIVAKVTESTPIAKPPLDYVFLKERFMTALGPANAGHDD